LKNYKRKFQGLFSILAGLTLLVLTLRSLLYPDRPMEKSELMEIHGKLTAPFDIDKPSLKNSGQQINFYIDKYPKVCFTIPHYGYKGINLSLLADKGPNDSLVFSISKQEFETKILITPKTTWFANIVRVYTLNINDKDHLTLDDYNKELLNTIDSNKFWIPIFIIICILIIVRGKKTYG
jgi:hypothetical protein